jgi:uncharacterized protein involved in response to NO
MPHLLPLHGEIPRPATAPKYAVAAKGFRPFFLLASLFATLIVPLWLLVLHGRVRGSPYLDPITWHAHEMIFGFAVAVIAGFLLTAVGNWTQRETLTGMPLLGLAMLWLAGRIALSAATAWPRALVAAVDLAFLPVLIVVLARPLVAARNTRNLVMIAVLSALTAANVVVHLEPAGVVPPGSALRASLAAVDLVLLMISIMATRVFPMFTRNATRVDSIRSIASLDVGSIVAMFLLLVADAFTPDSVVVRWIAGTAAILTAARAWHWGARHSLRHPLLWILHTGHAWLVIGLALRAVPAVPASLAWHVLTVGVIGALTLGMMARVALGHTGRLLAPSAAMPFAFCAINAAVAVRVFVPLLMPSWYLPALIVAGSLWALAFGIYLVVYAPILVSPRVDGKPG